MDDHNTSLICNECERSIILVSRSDLKVAWLRDACPAYGLPVSGNKDVLLQWLQPFIDGLANLYDIDVPKVNENFDSDECYDLSVNLYR